MLGCICCELPRRCECGFAMHLQPLTRCRNALNNLRQDNCGKCKGYNDGIDRRQLCSCTLRQFILSGQTHCRLHMHAVHQPSTPPVCTPNWQRLSNMAVGAPMERVYNIPNLDCTHLQWFGLACGALGLCGRRVDGGAATLQVVDEVGPGRRSQSKAQLRLGDHTEGLGSGGNSSATQPCARRGRRALEQLGRIVCSSSRPY